MLSQFRIIWQRLSTPSFMRALDGFSIQKIRNTKYDVCRTGEQTWKDMQRDRLLINYLSIDFNKLIEDFNRSNTTPLQDEEYRIVLHSIFNSTFNTIAGRRVHPLLIDECITMMNQTSLHGSLCTELMRYVGQDIQQRIFPENAILPAAQNFDTKIQVISDTQLKIEYTEAMNFRDVTSGDSVCSANGTFDFYINVNPDNSITYNNPKIKLELPTQISSQIFSTRMVMIRNMFSPLRNTVRRILSFITRSSFNSIKQYKITDANEISTIEYNVPGHTCTPVLLTQYKLINTIENTKENTTEETPESQRRNTEPQDHTPENNQITVSAMVHAEPAILPITETTNELKDTQQSGNTQQILTSASEIGYQQTGSEFHTQLDQATTQSFGDGKSTSSRSL
ncbi:hypothetical protein [Ehrlichia minasensis]|nr:hypothetical protein [Ehrlichia minasensis]